MRNLTYFIAVSLDGFIAGPEGQFDFFPMQGEHIDTLVREYPETFPAPALAAFGVTPENKTFDTIVMGWNTFDVGYKQGLDSPYPHLKQFVLSKRHLGAKVGKNVTVTDESPVALVKRLKEEKGTDIWLGGGGRLASALVTEIDRMVLKVNPVFLGRGIRLFETDAYAPRTFTLERSRPFSSGVVWNFYRKA